MSGPLQVDEEYSTTSDFPRTSSDPETYSDDSRGSTRSLKSAPELVEENGRFYCNETYLMPCDDVEQTRLSISYQTYLFMLDQQITLGMIPRRPKRILDLGTGTGDWAMAAAERFPEATVIALDITSAYLPGVAPPNLVFEVDNAEQDWTYNEPFDFIHIRELGGAFTDWSRIYAFVAKHLKVGGSVEVADHSRVKLTNEPPNSYTSIFNNALREASEKARTPLNHDHLQKSMFDAAQLSVTKDRTFELPVGQWHQDPKKKIVGKMALVATLEGIEAMGLRLLTKYQGFSAQDARDLMEKVRTEIANPEVKAFVQVRFVVARKIMEMD